MFGSGRFHWKHQEVLVDLKVIGVSVSLFILYSDRFGFKASHYDWAHSFVNKLAEAIELYYLG